MQQLASIHALRALAAITITVAHTNSETNWMAVHLGVPETLPGMSTGAAAVDLFFVISGFVMVYASAAYFGSASGAATFAARRLIRIVPAYWILTTVTLWYWYYGIGTHITQEGFGLDGVIASYLFVPWSRIGDPNNIGAPVLGVGWSLNYEMFFYAVFAGFLLLPRRAAILGCCLALTLYAFWGKKLGLPSAISYFANTSILAFVYGMGIGLAYVEGLRLPPRFAYALAAVGFALIAYTAIADVTNPRDSHWGIGSALIVAGIAFAGEPKDASGPIWRTVLLLGDASYALYLVHGLAMMAPRFEMPTFASWLGGQSQLAYAAFLTLVSIAAAILFHLAIERPMTNGLRNLLSARTGGRVQAPRAIPS